MADLLNQNDIDDLLNSSISEESEQDSAGLGEHEAVSTGRTKTYSFKTNKNIPFSFPYLSPIIKRNKIIFNPNPEIEKDRGKIVVRSLENYSKFLEYKKSD